MSTIAEFKIIGRVGAVKDVGSTVHVSIASSYSYKDTRGDWAENVKWNEVTIFSEATQGYVKRNIRKGDLVYAAGTLSQTSYERNGERVYGVTLAVYSLPLRQGLLGYAHQMTRSFIYSAAGPLRLSERQCRDQFDTVCAPLSGAVEALLANGVGDS